jgi:hypothetical protein
MPESRFNGFRGLLIMGLELAYVLLTINIFPVVNPSSTGLKLSPRIS